MSGSFFCLYPSKKYFYWYLNSMMIQNNYTNLNFKAKFIQKTSILKYNQKNKSYNQALASFVEYDPNNRRDLKAIYEAVKEWKEKFFAGEIVSNACLLMIGDLPKKTNHIYILTSQKDNLDKLNKKHVLGLAHVENLEGSCDELKYFEVNSDVKYSKNNRTYKHVGMGIINALKNVSQGKIKLVSSAFASKFYESQGFEPLDSSILEYIWKR